MEWGTHFHAALREWSHPATYGELLALIHTQSYLAVHRAKNAPKPDLPAPWDRPPLADVTPERREELTADLERRTAFRN
jgi:hypothetical protein